MNEPPNQDEHRPDQAEPDSTSVITREPSEASRVIPWILSTSLHVLVFALSFLFVWIAQVRQAADNLPVPDTRILDPSSDALQTTSNIPNLAQSDNFAKTAAVPTPDRQVDMLSQMMGKPKADMSIIGIGAGGEDGDLGRYGLQIGNSGSGPSFFGMGGTVRGARRIVYVVDHSGSMADTFRYVQAELKRSIDDLRRSQKFSVIFFSEDYRQAPPEKLVSAIRANKERAYGFIDAMVSMGGTDPIPAMRRAFEEKPDLIYFLTDGLFDPKLLPLLRQWNPDQKVKIFTFAYLDRQGAELLKQIAHENGGEFKYISEDELRE